MENENITTAPAEVETADAEAVATVPAEAQELAAAESEARSAEEKDGGKDTELAKPWKNEQNARFAEQRRRKEAEEAAFRALVDGVNNPDTGKPFADRREWEAWKRKASIAARAQRAQIAPETYEQIVEQAREELKRSDPELQAQAQQLEQYKQRERENIFSNDLKAIRKAYPDEKAKSIEELGPQFVAMCASGVSPLAAYEALRAEKARSVKQPPSMGEVRPKGSAGKEFFTREEVAAMNPTEVSKNYDRIRKSMEQWK